jgi:hypothetical protein
MTKHTTGRRGAWNFFNGLHYSQRGGASVFL